MTEMIDRTVQFRRTLARVALLATMSATMLGAQANQPPQLHMAASSFASVEVHINARPIGKDWFLEDAGLSGPARIAITYGQPHARGRRIEGGLVPLDSVWRFGANMATTLHTDVDMMLGDVRVPKGDYTLFLQYRRDGWDMIINRGTAQWGTDHDATKDIARVKLQSRTMAEPEETLSIYLVPDSQQPTSGYATLGGMLRIKFGTTELKAPWSVIQ